MFALLKVRCEKSGRVHVAGQASENSIFPGGRAAVIIGAGWINKCFILLGYMKIYPKYPTPVCKLYGVSVDVRRALKTRSITNVEQLLEAAARHEDREALALARATRLDLATLTAIVQRADMTRIRGSGFVFARMLAEVGVPDVATLAVQAPQALHLRLHVFNQAERLARRSPTLEEIIGWVSQARRLPAAISYSPQEDSTAIPIGPVVDVDLLAPAPIDQLSSGQV